jgi:site-specific recombinase XerD
MTNDEVFEKIHEEFILRGMSTKTEDSYLCAFRAFLRYYENRDVETMGEETIREFLSHQISIGKSSGTVNIYNSALRFIFGGVLGQNLNCRIPRRSDHREIPTIMSKAEIVRFFSVIDNLRDKAIFETIYVRGYACLKYLNRLRMPGALWYISGAIPTVKPSPITVFSDLKTVLSRSSGAITRITAVGKRWR